MVVVPMRAAEAGMAVEEKRKLGNSKKSREDSPVVSDPHVR